MTDQLTVPVEGAVIVRGVPIIGTDWIVFSAWERYSMHSTCMSVQGGWIGRIGTKPPSELVLAGKDNLDVRIGQVQDHYKAEKARAIQAILDHEPKLQHVGIVDHTAGEITVKREDLD